MGGVGTECRRKRVGTYGRFPHSQHLTRRVLRILLYTLLDTPQPLFGRFRFKLYPRSGHAVENGLPIYKFGVDNVVDRLVGFVEDYVETTTQSAFCYLILSMSRKMSGKRTLPLRPDRQVTKMDAALSMPSLTPL